MTKSFAFARLALLALFGVGAACVSNASSSNHFPSDPPPNPSGEPPNEAVGPEAAGAPMGNAGPEKAHRAPDPGPTVVGNAPAPLPAPPVVADNEPIDPTSAMPADTLGTNSDLTLDQPASVVVDGRADLMSSGLGKPDAARKGVLPTKIKLVKGGGVVRFRDVRGKTACGGAAPAGPDNPSCAGLVAVFLGDKATELHVGGASSPGRAQSAPALGETFFVGDGMTGAGAGELQAFQIPKGATRLFLGYVGTADFHGNTGGVSATVTQHK